jgi:4'-phosphopantetheinyl transferase
MVATGSPEWPAVSGTLRLDGDDVQVWLVALDADGLDTHAHGAALSDDEHVRAARFYFERDRRRYRCARGALRAILAGYLEVQPSDVAFEYGSHGKPAIDRRFGSPIAFNVSHSGELALIACSRRGALGVDIEEVRPMADADDIASRFFSPREAERFRTLPPAVRNEAFFRCWTRKEAYVKAVGDGLACPLDGFDVTFAPGEPAALTVDGNAIETGRWALCAIDTPDGYAGALVTEGARRVSCWRYTTNGHYVKETV